MNTSENMYTVVTMEYRLSNPAGLIDLDWEDEFRTHLRSLQGDENFHAAIIGCSAEDVPHDAHMKFSVDFGHPAIQ